VKGFPVVTEEKVRYMDLDPFGHMNNTTFLRFFEQVRIAYFRRIGLFGPEGRGDRNLTLAETSCRFLAEGGLDDQVRCGGRMVRLGKSSCEMEYRLERDGAAIADGKAVLVYFDFNTRSSTPIPEELRAKIRALEGRADL
jgi:acyl-CoA thioester hydrolase